VKDVAFALDLDPAKFFYVVQNADNGTYYRQFNIPKKSGGYRQISQPTRGLGLAQTRLANALNHHYRRRDYVKGYVKGTSFIENAQYHEKQRWILNIDIEDFFPSIGFARIRGMFLSRLFDFNPRVSTILARITTFQDQLPQGARTSPILANFIAHNLDKRLLEIARDNRLRYTRYADDITFSSSDRRIPASVISSIKRKYEDGNIDLSPQVVDAFARSSFKINPKKTRLMLRSDRQEVTGLIVNEGVNVWRRDIQRLRLKLYSCKKHGMTEAARIWTDGGDAKKLEAHLVGSLAYIRQVKGDVNPTVAKLCKIAYDAGITSVDWIERTADMVKEFDVFLSHASEDKPKVRKLKESLEGVGVSVFFDEDSIKWGDSIVQKINFGLLKSRYFIPYLTDTFAKKGWTNKELNSAIANSASRKGRILPIKDADFSVDASYPLLNETLYREWPSDTESEEDFIKSTTDALLLLIETDKLSDT
jgi:RNA-directed DNA polymerase